MAIFVNGCPAEFLLGQSLAYTTLLRPKKKKTFQALLMAFFSPECVQIAFEISM